MAIRTNGGIVENTVRSKLRSGGIAVGYGVRQGRTSDTVIIAEHCGFDWLFIDMEHNSMDVDAVAQLCVAALPSSVTPIVRVPGPESFHATRVLDAGAMGIIVPHVDTAEQARQVVATCKFPPLGTRSVPGSMPQLGFAALSQAECCEVLNENTLVVVMLESAEAIANAPEIAAIEGIDVLLIGTSDLTAALGIPGEFAHPHVREAYERVIEACGRHGKIPGMGGIYDPALMQVYVEMGARFLLGGSDLSFLLSGAKQRIDALRTVQIDGGKIAEARAS